MWSAGARAQVSSTPESGTAAEAQPPVDPDPQPVDPPPAPSAGTAGDELDSSSITESDDGPPEPQKVRVSLVEVSDLSGRGSVTKLRSLIESLLNEDPRLEVLPQGMFQLHARKLRIAKDQWLTPE